jgi:glycosyltransferase involved in cell wall biosynthesis
MRVLMLSQAYPSPAYPALGVFIRSAAHAMAAHAEVDVLSPRPYTLPLPFVPYGGLATLPMRTGDGACTVHRPRYVYPVPKRWLYPLAGPSYARSVRAYADLLTRPDVIHAHWSYPDGYGGLALREQFSAPLVVHARGTLERVIVKQHPSWRSMIARSLTGADAVISNSRALTADCQELGVEPARIHMIPDGIDLTLFGPGDRAEARARLRLPGDRFVVLYCGNLREVKGTHVLAEAIARCSRADVCFALVGGGEMESGLRARFAAELRSGRVVMPGYRPYQEMPIYMRAADLFVLPSLSEARSNVIPEALACETPVVASDVGGIPEVMEPAHGKLVPPGDPGALLAAIDELLAHPKSLRAMGRAGRAFLLSNGLTWADHARRTLELYAELVRARR